MRDFHAHDQVRSVSCTPPFRVNKNQPQDSVALSCTPAFRTHHGDGVFISLDDGAAMRDFVEQIADRQGGQRLPVIKFSGMRANQLGKGGLP